MRNASGYQSENELQWKNRVNRNTNISSIKRRNKKLKEVSHFSRAKQRQGNVQKVCYTCKVVFLLIRKKVRFTFKVVFFASQIYCCCFLPLSFFLPWYASSKVIWLCPPAKTGGLVSLKDFLSNPRQLGCMFPWRFLMNWYHHLRVFDKPINVFEAFSDVSIEIVDSYSTYLPLFPKTNQNVGRLTPTKQGPVVRRPISANPGLNFNLGFYFFCSKAFFRIIFSILFRASNHQIVDKKNKTKLAF